MSVPESREVAMHPYLAAIDNAVREIARVANIPLEVVAPDLALLDALEENADG